MGGIRSIETEYNGYRFRSRLEARWAIFFDALGVDYEYEPEGFELPSGKRYLPDFRVRCYGKRGACMDPQSMRDAGIYGLCAVCKHRTEEGMYSWQYHCANESIDRDEYGSVDCVKIDVDANCMCTKCDGFKLGTGNYFDLYIEVKGRMTQEDADRIKEFAGSAFDENGLWDEKLARETHPILIVGNIPREGCSSDGYALGVYDGMDGTDVSQFNYQLIDGDDFGAYPAAHNGYFYLWGDDSNYINGCDVDAVERAYKIARQARFEHGETPDARSIRRSALHA